MKRKGGESKAGKEGAEETDQDRMSLADQMKSLNLNVGKVMEQVKELKNIDSEVGRVVGQIKDRSDREVSKVMEQVKKQTLTLVTAAFGLVAALVWNDAIKAWLKPLYEGASGPMGLTVSAIILTMILVITTIILAKMLGPKP